MIIFVCLLATGNWSPYLSCIAASADGLVRILTNGVQGGHHF